MAELSVTLPEPRPDDAEDVVVGMPPICKRYFPALAGYLYRDFQNRLMINKLNRMHMSLLNTVVRTPCLG